MTHDQLESITRALVNAVEVLARGTVALNGSREVGTALARLEAMQRVIADIDHPPSAPAPPPPSAPAAPKPANHGKIAVYYVRKAPTADRSGLLKKGAPFPFDRSSGVPFPQEKKVIRGYGPAFGIPVDEAARMDFSKLPYLEVRYLADRDIERLLGAGG